MPENMKNVLIIIFVIVGSLAFVVLGILSFLFIKRKANKKKVSDLEERYNSIHDTFYTDCSNMIKRVQTIASNNSNYQSIYESTNSRFNQILKDNDKSCYLAVQSLKNLIANKSYKGIGSIIGSTKISMDTFSKEAIELNNDLQAILKKEEDLRKIESKMKDLSKKNEYIIREDVSKEKALEIFKDDEYKEELISELSEDDEISIYKQGSYVDLCLGPHVPSTGFVKYFKLDTIAGAYWRGNSENKQLTRIYGLACFTKEELEEKERLKEEAKKRDHRKIGKELGLFMISEFGPGFPFFLPNGLMLRRDIN